MNTFRRLTKVVPAWAFMLVLLALTVNTLYFIYKHQTGVDGQSNHRINGKCVITYVTPGSKVLFAGGLNLGSMTASNVVDIYDVETGDWDTAYLSEARFAMGEAVTANVAVFAGGDKLASFSDRVDLYNFTTNTWSTETLFLPRGYTAAAGAEDKVMVVGGMTDPYDSTSAPQGLY